MTTGVVVLLIMALVGITLYLLVAEAKRDMENVVREWPSSEGKK